MADEKTFTQEDLDAAVEKEVKGLKTKNEELLGENKKLKQSQKELDDRLKTLEESAEEAERIKAEKDGDVASAVAAAEKKAQKTIDKLQADLDTATARVEKHLVDGGLTGALVEAGVAKEFLPAVKALVKTGHKVEIGENDTVMVDGKPLPDFVGEWAQGDQGKHYIAADANRGGGAEGASGGGGAPAGKKASEMKDTEKAAFITEHGLQKWQDKVRAESS